MPIRELRHPRSKVLTLPLIISASIRQREKEVAPAAHRGIGPDPAAMPMYDALGRGKPDPGPLELALLVHPLESPEKPIRIPHVETGAIIPQVKDLAVPFPFFDRTRSWQPPSPW